MGERAIVIFEGSAGDMGAEVYVHNLGLRVPEMLEELKEQMLPDRPDDVVYATARFTALACAKEAPPYGVGVDNRTTELTSREALEKYAHLIDNGVFIVNAVDFSWKQYVHNGDKVYTSEMEERYA